MAEKNSLKPDNYGVPESVREGEGALPGLGDSQRRIEMRNHEREVRLLRRRIAELWLALVLAVIAAGTGYWWGYRQLAAGEDLLSQLPEARTMIADLRTRVGSVEEGLSALGDRVADVPMMQQVTARITRVERSLNAGLKAAREQAAEVAAQVERRVQEAVDLRIRPIETQVGELKSAEDRRDARVGELEGRLDDVRRDVGLELARLRESNERDAAGVQNQIAGTQRAIDGVARQLERSRVDFELSQGGSEEVAPGIRLHVSSADQARQMIDGWMHLPADGSIVWIREQPIDRSVVFRTPQDGRAYELVFTRVRGTTAIGYLLVPEAGSISTAGQTPKPEVEGDVSELTGP